MRLITTFSFVLLLLSSPALIAQENAKSTFVRIGALWPRISVEQQTGKITSFKAGLGVAYHKETNTETEKSRESILYHKPRGGIFSGNEEGSYDELVPFITLQGRFYYNLKKRSNEGKIYENLSANYLAIRDYIYFDGLNTIGIVYGIQRHRDRFYFDLNFGIGNGTYKKKSSAVLLSDITFGILIF